jgi:hypothetical protein
MVSGQSDVFPSPPEAVDFGFYPDRSGDAVGAVKLQRLDSFWKGFHEARRSPAEYVYSSRSAARRESSAVISIEIGFLFMPSFAHWIPCPAFTWL